MGKEIEIIGKMDHTMDHTFESANRVYGTQGICPTLPTCGGGNIQPKIMECVAMRGRGEKNEQQLEIRSDECTNSITTVQKDNMCLEEIKLIDTLYGQHSRWGVYDQNGTSPTITASMGLGGGHIPMVFDKEKTDILREWTWEIDGELYLIRIRKLTPRECWRLMGFTDEDFDKAQEVNSNTQLYKQAGNSIVVPVLEGIFKGLTGRSEI
jgi:DNA (cytosine-5)-methyltransferase 1